MSSIVHWHRTLQRRFVAWHKRVVPADVTVTVSDVTHTYSRNPYSGYARCEKSLTGQLSTTPVYSDLLTVQWTLESLVNLQKWWVGHRDNPIMCHCTSLCFVNCSGPILGSCRIKMGTCDKISSIFTQTLVSRLSLLKKRPLKRTTIQYCLLHYLHFYFDAIMNCTSFAGGSLTRRLSISPYPPNKRNARSFFGQLRRPH